ncbi:MAG: M56 family metallopeptidase, partial [Bacteroidota bacterium]
MIPYILETIAFQLVFLLVYDLFLKKETFFQWNRAYLLITFMLSLNLPWIKIEAFKTIIQPEALFYPDFLWQLNSMEFTVNPTEKTSLWESLSSYEWTFFIGFLLMSIWFVFKVYRIQRLRSRGTIYYYQAFTKVVVRESQVAFSFFNQIFLGDGIPPDKEPQIMAHELVHIRQWHSLDLLFFEVMRIVMWFNPMVYLYQNRMAELQEFIADSKVAKGNKSAQYQLLLSEAFRTQNLSFVNQFFKESLIKKRIVMLTRTKSKTILQLKYLLLLPIILGMLFYSSCERETNKGDVILETIEVGNIANLTKEEETKAFNRLINLSVQSKNWRYIIKDKNSTVTFRQGQEGSFISGPGGAPIKATMQMESGILDKDFDIFKF